MIIRRDKVMSLCVYIVFLLCNIYSKSNKQFEKMPKSIDIVITVTH